MSHVKLFTVCSCRYTRLTI